MNMMMMMMMMDAALTPAKTARGGRPKSWTRDQWIAKCKEEGVNKLLVPDDSDKSDMLQILSIMLKTEWQAVKEKHGWKQRESDDTGETFPDEAMKKEYQILVAMLHPPHFRSHVQDQLHGVKPRKLVGKLWEYGT